jgi:hypothetical protein
MCRVEGKRGEPRQKEDVTHLYQRLRKRACEVGCRDEAGFSEHNTVSEDSQMVEAIPLLTSRGVVLPAGVISRGWMSRRRSKTAGIVNRDPS